MVRLPRYSFIGTQTAQISIAIKSFPTEDVIDSKFDIAFISQKFLRRIHHPSRILLGQRIKLIQVTVNTTIPGYDSENSYSHTIEGLVKISVETYVVKGMSTLFNLGDYFANRYSITVVQRDRKGRLG